MKTMRPLPQSIAASMLLSFLILIPDSSLASGPLIPPGAPAPMWKSLQEIQPRTLIASLPYNIVTPGSYYLSNNLTVNAGTAITIAASSVTLDLNGCTLASTETTATEDAGIAINGGLCNIAIMHGAVQGFGNGIVSSGASNVWVSGVAVSGCTDNGIIVGGFGFGAFDVPLNNPNTIVEACTVTVGGTSDVTGFGGVGISASIVKGCSAVSGGGDGISAYQVSDSMGYALLSGLPGTAFQGTGIVAVSAINSYGYSAEWCGLSAYVADNCLGYSSNNGEYGLNAYTANNCFGDCASLTGIGLDVTDANGCTGVGGFAGVWADGTANGCYGTSPGGYGIWAGAAHNCQGYSTATNTTGNSVAALSAAVADNCTGGMDGGNPQSGISFYGVQAEAAHNCTGGSTYGPGVYVYPGTAENCFGSSTYGAGVNAVIANNCYGCSTNADGILATTANNCYGVSQSNDGLDAVNANNCYGFSQTGSWGLYCNVANNSYGNCTGGGNYGAGLYAGSSANNCSGYNTRGYGNGLQADIAIGCYGYDNAVGGIGLYVNIANSCDGNSDVITHKYNMP